MALDLSGIENVEFYSPHYLDAVLEKDLKVLFDSWRDAKREEGRRTPPEALAALAETYFRARQAADAAREPTRRFELARAFHVELLEALGYRAEPKLEPLEPLPGERDPACPTLLSLDTGGRPFLWVLETPFPSDADDDPLEARPLLEQAPGGPRGVELPIAPDLPASQRRTATWAELVVRLFRLEQPPRWLLILSGSEAVLAERGKWPQGKLLRFDFGALFSRREAQALRATAGLLHRDALAPESGTCLHDTLDEGSHKHAYAVSADLKFGVRKAVELLANEAIRYRREVSKTSIYGDDELAEKLTAECLNWLYRLLFLFYVEARGAELGVVPMKSDVYRKGYSLETLRELELVPLTTEEARNGTYLHDSLVTLFRLLNRGFPDLGSDATDEKPMHDTLLVDALKSPLFDDERLEILGSLRLRNFVVQEILQLLSLSAEAKGRQRGRISYAQLGINQLGAVYEGLLSYTGFFAREEDLYEVATKANVKKISGRRDAERTQIAEKNKIQTYFVPESRIDEYDAAEIVRDENDRRVVHRRGSYLFRLAGRNREKSASYYTPEVLTECLVKYALQELLFEIDEDFRPGERKVSADEILELTLCEPAMGSGAFLLEAVDQLADHYLDARQAELGQRIDPADYQHHKRRVKARLATNNCYGVDLNPTAVELAKVSLWLGTLYEGGKCPWFGLRLASGNSLIGARREVYDTSDLTHRGTKDAPNWLGLAPQPVPHPVASDTDDSEGESETDELAPLYRRPEGTVYHFLLPSSGMAPFDKDKVIKELLPDDVARIKKWRARFTRPLEGDEVQRLETLSDAVDRLFGEVARERILATRASSDRISVWPDPEAEPGVHGAAADLLVRDQEEIAQSLESSSSAFRRLELVMHAWCALWFWPLEKSELLPDRETWLSWLELILLGQVTREPAHEQLGLPLFADVDSDMATGGAEASYSDKTDDAAGTYDESERVRRLRALSHSLRTQRESFSATGGLADVDAIVRGDEGLQLVDELAQRHGFHHWELRFAETFAERGGFDLVVGNPPWVLLSFNEKSALGDIDPRLQTKKLSAFDARELRRVTLSAERAKSMFVQELQDTTGAQEFLGHIGNYPLLSGMKANLYKCFITRAWSISESEGVTAFLHPEGVYDDPRGGLLRAALYPRLVAHYQFFNELLLFSEVSNHAKFGVNVYGPPRSQVGFFSASNVFHPRAIDESWAHGGKGLVPGIKDSNDQFDSSGHRERLVSVDEEVLALFALLYDMPGTSALEARLPVVHSREILSVLSRFGEQPKRLGDLKGEYFCTQHWNETTAQEDGTVRRETRYPVSASEWVLQGPHFYLGNLFSKTPNEACESNRDYTAIDLTAIPSDYLPRTNYVPACELEEYRRRTPKWKGRLVTEFYRYVHREMINQTAERSLLSCVVPPGLGHVNTVFGVVFSDPRKLLALFGLSTSLPYDFFLRSTGKGHANASLLELLPFPPVSRQLVEHSLGLCALTSHFAELEERVRRSSAVGRLGSESLDLYGRPWTAERFRTDFGRRLALVGIDVLASMALDLTLDDLLTIYRQQFPVLQQYERERLYDQHGRIVPRASTASGSPCVNLVKLAASLRESCGFDIEAPLRPGDPETAEFLARRVKLSTRDASLLGVGERCELGELLAETEVTYYDDGSAEGRTERLLGIRYTDPGLEPRLERVYPTPWTRCDREEDYRVAWAEFEARLGAESGDGESSNAGTNGAEPVS